MVLRNEPKQIGNEAFQSAEKPGYAGHSGTEHTDTDYSDSNQRNSYPNHGNTDYKPKVLIVDDEPGIVRILSKILKGKGYETITAPDGLKAWDIYQRDSIDFVLSDIDMPKMTGYELLGRIRELNPDAKVVLMTGRPDQSRYDLVKNGALDVLSKPFEMDALNRIIKQYLP